jgi:hypothetical protein
MPNYSLEEICKNCEHAVWHVCENCYDQESPRFCHCKVKSEEKTNCHNGTCPNFKYIKKENSGQDQISSIDKV